MTPRNSHCCEFTAGAVKVGFLELADNGYYYLGAGWIGHLYAGDPVFLVRCPGCGACLDE